MSRTKHSKPQLGMVTHNPRRLRQGLSKIQGPFRLQTDWGAGGTKLDRVIHA